jgi:SAM-dependent methyltransferase
MTRGSYTETYQDAGAAEFYDRVIYDPEGPSSAFWEVEQRSLDRLLARYCPGHREGDTLDFACGTGRILAFLKPRVKTLVGVDVSPVMLARAGQRVKDVELICADIIADSAAVPGGKDLITSFRFLLLAEPGLRRACVRALAEKLRGRESVMILNSHGNPWSFRMLASLRDACFGRGTRKLPAFSLRDMKQLADECGLEIVGVTGLGFVPGTLARVLPRKLVAMIERALADRPVIWRWGSHLLFVCRRK